MQGTALAGRYGEGVDRDLDTLVRRLQLEEVDVDLEQARLAREAAIRYGRSRHRADFSHTDVRVAAY